MFVFKGQSKLRPLVIAGVAAITMSACGSQPANGVSAQAAPKAPAVKQPPLTAADLSAKAAFSNVNWDGIAYPGLASHCHPAAGKPAQETGKVVGYIPRSNVAVVVGSCANVVGTVPTGVYLFSPPTPGSRSPKLDGVLVKVPPSPLLRDNPSSVFYYTAIRAGNQPQQATPSPPGTTTKDAYTVGGPVLPQVECVTHAPAYIDSNTFTVVGLTDPNFEEADIPPAAIANYAFTLKGLLVRLDRVQTFSAARYSCP